VLTHVLLAQLPLIAEIAYKSLTKDEHDNPIIDVAVVAFFAMTTSVQGRV
jgi:hypothetical protein